MIEARIALDACKKKLNSSSSVSDLQLWLVTKVRKRQTASSDAVKS
jgi:hypothetical protein